MDFIHLEQWEKKVDNREIDEFDNREIDEFDLMDYLDIMVRKTRFPILDAIKTN